MSEDEQRALLTEYDQWKATKENETVDLSPEAFLAERGLRLAQKRVDDLLELMAYRHRPGDTLESFIERVHEILAADRPMIDDRTITGLRRVSFA